MLPANGTVARRQSSLIFSQGDREIGSRARFLGVKRLTSPLHETQTLLDRRAKVHQREGWDVSERVIGACIEVHRCLGPGLLESDLIVDGQLLVEIKSIETLLFVHVAQAVTYLRVTGLPAGLIVNFNTALLRDGLRRVSLPQKFSHDSGSPDLPVKKSRPS